jgi:hypothetical protein
LARATNSRNITSTVRPQAISGTTFSWAVGSTIRPHAFSRAGIAQATVAGAVAVRSTILPDAIAWTALAFFTRQWATKSWRRGVARCQRGPTIWQITGQATGLPVMQPIPHPVGVFVVA